MRSDKKTSLAKVAKTVLANPLDTERDIAEKAGVSNGTAHNMIKELEQTGAKDPRIVGLTDKDFELMQKIQDIKFKRLEKPEEVNNRDIDTWENTANKRYTLFRGSATDEQGGVKNVENIQIL